MIYFNILFISLSWSHTKHPSIELVFGFGSIYFLLYN